MNFLLDDIDEEWLTIDEFPDYVVSDLGRVKNVRTGRIIVPRDNGHEVLQVNLSQRGYSASRQVKKLVAEAFIPRPMYFERKNSCVIRHIDEDWTNCRADNLNYCLRADAAFIKRVGVSWGRPVLAVTSGVVYEDAVEAAKAYKFGCDISIKKICMMQEGWHCGETFRWA